MILICFQLSHSLSLFLRANDFFPLLLNVIYFLLPQCPGPLSPETKDDCKLLKLCSAAPSEPLTPADPATSLPQASPLVLLAITAGGDSEGSACMCSLSRRRDNRTLTDHGRAQLPHLPEEKMSPSKEKRLAQGCKAG